jgi:outer membrane receptor for ferric coprogen and ferric-rhodotorulic acid
MIHPTSSLHRTLTGAALLAGALLNGVALAQDTETASSDEVVTLAPLEVSAQAATAAPPALSTTRLEMTPRETPQSVSTIDQERMELENFFSVDDVLRNVTGVHVSFYDTERPLYFARGFQITDFQIDGMPTYSGSTNQEFDTALYDHITVVRGANGLITGAGMPSATVDLHRKKPGKELAATVSGSVGSWDFYRGVADVNLPLTQDGSVRGRIVGVGQTKESFLDRYSDDTTAFLASFEADLTPTTTVGLGYQVQDNEPESPTWGTIPRFAADGTEANLPRSINFAADWTYWSRQSDTTFITLDQQLGENWNFRAAYSRTTGDYKRLAVYANGNPDTTTGGGLFLLSGANQSEDMRDNLDLYLSGKFTLLDREHDVVVGFNFDDYESDAAVLGGDSGWGAGAWTYVIPDYRTYNGLTPTMPVVFDTGADRVTHTRQHGFYGTTRLRPLDPLAIILGARVSTWETHVDNYAATGAYTGRTGAAEVNNELTPYAGFVYDLTPDVAVYASYTETFRPQTQKDRNFNTLSPSIGSNAEIGLKTEFLDDRLTANVAVFETKLDNYAIVDATQPPNSLPDGSTPHVGVDGTESRGFEVDLTARITPDWSASLGYSNVNTRRHPTDLTYANVPEHLLRFNTRYRLPGDWSKLTLGAGINWQGEQVGSVTTHPTITPIRVTQDAFALVNFFADYRFNEHLSATLSVRNAFDETYWATLDYPNYGEPRSVQLTVRYKF